MIAKEIFRKKERLWNPNFLFLWHGQVASGFGDRLYTIAIGFWVLALTRSTAMMGIFMALIALPRILVPAFALPRLEKMNKKLILVLMNLIRGICITFIGIAIFIGYVQLWMLFLAGLVINLCGAVFNPVVKFSLPNIVPKSTLGKAHSITDMIRHGTVIIGNFVGGLLFQLLGASHLFILNGLSFLISAFTGLLIEIPETCEAAPAAEPEQELTKALMYEDKLRNLRYPLLMAAAINFLGNIGLILFLPLFQNIKTVTRGGLEIFLAFLIGSVVLGILFTCIASIPASKRLTLFIIMNFASGLGYATWPLFDDVPMMLGVIFITGLFSAMYNVYVTSSIQLAVPEKIRIKVFGLIGISFPGLPPLAMAVGGILAEFVSIRVLIFAAQMLILILVTPMASINSFKRFVNFDAERETLADIV